MSFDRSLPIPFRSHVPLRFPGNAKSSSNSWVCEIGWWVSRLFSTPAQLIYIFSISIAFAFKYFYQIYLRTHIFKKRMHYVLSNLSSKAIVQLCREGREARSALLDIALILKQKNLNVLKHYIKKQMKQQAINPSVGKIINMF